MELIRYLNEGFFTEAQLLAAGGIDRAQLKELQRRGIMPQPSYRLKLDLACDSFFGPHGEQVGVDYYAQGYASWIGTIQTLARDADAYEVFTERYQRRLEQLRAAGTGSQHDKLNAGLDQHLEDEWRHFLGGAYGLCTRTGLPEDIAAKEVAIAIIKDITERRQQPELSDAERRPGRGGRPARRRQQPVCAARAGAQLAPPADRPDAPDLRPQGKWRAA